MARPAFTFAALLLTLCCVCRSQSISMPSGAQRILVGTQYNTTHVYVAPEKMDALVKSFVAVFGGHLSARVVTNVLPVPSSTESQVVFTPAGNLSVFAYQTPIPYLFGGERNGYLVTDMDIAVKDAVSAGAEVVVEPFKDPIGRDAVIQWPGGVKMQLYWHFTAPFYPPLQTIPESRIYVSRRRADELTRDLIKFGHGKVVSDDRRANGGEIGRPGETYRRIRIESDFGKMALMVTDGHLPYPFGYETTGYQTADLSDTVRKARAAGASILSPTFNAADRSSTMVEFPGGYIAEVHELKLQ